MCGIVGLCGTMAAVDIDLIVSMRDSLRHRGPDGEGLWISPDKTVGLAHRRLAVVDLSQAAAQPMVDHAERFVLIFNGEIYNHHELRKELIQLGHRFRSQSDTEVLLEGYKEWGVEVLSHLNGMFAFALFDKADRSIFLARDRVGEKPLFYTLVNGSLLFASELKALIKFPGVSRKISQRALGSYLAYGYVDSASCILEGVNKLPPGHALTFTQATSNLRLWRYWELPPQRSEPLVDDEALVDEIGDLLCDSVRRQLVADVPVGILLSGGLDSSLLTAAAVKVSRSPIRTYTVRFPGHGFYDEGRHARIVADHFGTNHTELVALPASLEVLPKLATQYDEPMCDSSMVPTYLVSQLIRKTETVALGGDGGDELFGGYPSYNFLMRQERITSQLPMPVRQLMAATARRAMPIGMRGRNYLTSLECDLPQRIARVNRMFDAAGRKALIPSLFNRSSYDKNSEPETFKERLFKSIRGLPGSAMEVDFASYLPCDILVKIDRASMLASLEMRSPWLDYRIIEFAFSRVPDRLRADFKQRKILLRNLARKMLPANLDVSRKQGFSLPLREWFRGSWGAYAVEVLCSKESTFFDKRAISELLRGQRRGLSNTERIFCLLLFELWRREYKAHL
jgi:asparagine synthase (glutamine-hydrolysing)